MPHNSPQADPERVALHNLTQVLDVLRSAQTNVELVQDALAAARRFVYVDDVEEFIAAGRRELGTIVRNLEVLTGAVRVDERQTDSIVVVDPIPSPTGVVFG